MSNLVGSTTAVFPVRLSVASNEIVNVEWTTSDGTALSGLDYKAAKGVVKFLPGETEKQIQALVYGQPIVPAADKVFYIRLSPPSNAILVDSLLTCKIVVDDLVDPPATSIIVAEGRRGPKGETGRSAYEQAVYMGLFTGTVEQWMQQIADASSAADRAENAAVAANIGSKVYATPQAGVNINTGVPAGDYFNVRSLSSNHYVDEYQNVAGVATATGKSYPNIGWVERNAAIAEAAAISATISSGIYQTPSAGVAPVTGVPVGDYFNVRSVNSEHYVDEYQNVAGVATATGKSYPSSLAVDLTKQQILDVSDRVGNTWYEKPLGYRVNDRVMLDSGDIVKSTEPNNLKNPNVDMTGWVNEHNTLLNEFSSLKIIKPQFVETLLSFGKYGIGAPSGVSNYAGGNYVLTVSGNQGDTSVTVNSGNIAHASGSWAAVIEYADGSFGLYQVQGYTGSQLNIFPALNRSVSNVKLGNIHDMVAGQHYTELGYKAFAQHIYKFNAKYALRDKFIAQFYGSDATGSWSLTGAPSITYNRGLSPSGADNLIKGDHNRNMTVKANANNEGVYWDVSLGKGRGYVEINAGLFEGSSATIEFYLDSKLVSTRTIGLAADRFVFEYTNYATGRILVKANAGTTVRIGRTVWWSDIGTSEELIPRTVNKIAYMGDSWGTYHYEALPKEILRLHKLVNPNATLINRSQGGMTTKYAVAWVDHVLAQNPDVVIIEYFTNDSNCIIGASSGINFTRPDGTIDNTYVTREDFFNNLIILTNKCINAGVQPILIMPSTVESQLQTQYHAQLASDEGRGAASIPLDLNLNSVSSKTASVEHVLTDKIETKTLVNTALEIITSAFGAIVKPRVMRYGDNVLFQVQNFNGSKLFEVVADELIGNRMPSLRLTGIYAEQGLKLVKTQIVDSVVSAYSGNVLRIKGQASGDLKSIQIGENSNLVELKAPTIPFVATSLPSASSSNRGQTYLVQAGTGIADKLYICIKNASEGYEWKEL